MSLGAAKTLFFTRLFRSQSFLSTSYPCLEVLSFATLDPTQVPSSSSSSSSSRSSSSSLSAVSLPSLPSSRQSQAAASLSAAASGGPAPHPFCTALAAPPRAASKFGPEQEVWSGGGLAAPRRLPRSSSSMPPRDVESWRLFVGRGDGQLECYSLRLDEVAGEGSSSSSSSSSLSSRTPVTALGVLKPALPFNVLAMCVDDTASFLYAGGDGGVLRCFDVLTLLEVPSLFGATTEWKDKRLREGSLCAYALLHHDVRSDAKANNMSRMTEPKTQGGAFSSVDDDGGVGEGSLLIGNLNGSIVVWDLEAQAVSAVLALEEDPVHFSGSCGAICVIKRDSKTAFRREKVLALTNGGTALRMWDTENIWDACPEVEGSVVVKLPLRRFDVNLPSPHAAMLILPPPVKQVAAADHPCFLYVAVGSSIRSTVAVLSLDMSPPSGGCDIADSPLHSVPPVETAPGQFKSPSVVLSWAAGAATAYTSLDDTAPHEEDGHHMVGTGGGLGAASLCSWGGGVLVGGCDGKLRLWRDWTGGRSAADIDGSRLGKAPPVVHCDASFAGVTVGGVCPLQGLHTFGANAGGGAQQVAPRHTLALLSVGWDRTAKVWTPKAGAGAGKDGEGRKVGKGDKKKSGVDDAIFGGMSAEDEELLRMYDDVDDLDVGNEDMYGGLAEGDYVNDSLLNTADEDDNDNEDGGDGGGGGGDNENDDDDDDGAGGDEDYLNYDDDDADDDDGGEDLDGEEKRDAYLDFEEELSVATTPGRMTDRSNFSVNDARAEMNRILADTSNIEGRLEQTTSNPNKQDWREAVAAANKVLSQK